MKFHPRDVAHPSCGPLRTGNLRSPRNWRRDPGAGNHRIFHGRISRFNAQVMVFKVIFRDSQVRHREVEEWRTCTLVTVVLEAFFFFVKTRFFFPDSFWGLETYRVGILPFLTQVVDKILSNLTRRQIPVQGSWRRLFEVTCVVSVPGGQKWRSLFWHYWSSTQSVDWSW